MSGRYELLTPVEAVDRLAVDLPGGRADAEQVIASYLRDATGVHGRPSSGWRMDEFDLDDARARFGWVDFAGGETVAAARTRADAAAVAALRDARGTSAITERARLFGLHSDAEMWGYRAHSMGLDELTNTAACDPQPRLVTVAREGRERSHREATAAHDTWVLAAEAAAAASATTADHHHQQTDRDPREQRSGDHEADDTMRGADDRNQDEGWSLAPDGRRMRMLSDEHPSMRALRAEMEAAARTDDGPDLVREDERGDRERVLDEGPGAFVGGMWFTPDPAVEGGIRPLTDTEMRRVSDMVRATQAEALADDLAPHDIPSSAPRADDDATEWGR
ncbi:hypothetical protein [Pseudonocardia sp. HH130630-07]|uniref:hypothetical protein n=1 Tax=Pseudonocardia sp. HH130630-07 TaxID=1690815 RepID=UPI000814EEB7|nr:hypothetical protein [Pseudonocardia sp. HH130630-07]ANY06917.1 hypothetical protein AFB00_12150 [Pseudonocardia sp. HH130630-07]